MRLGLNLAAFGDRPLQKALRDAAAMGVGHVEIPVHGGSPFFGPDGPDVAEMTAAVDAARAAGLQVSALDNHVDSHGLVGVEEGPAGRHRLRFEATLEAAAATGVEVVTCFFGEVPGTHWFRWPDAGQRDRAFTFLARRWLPLLDRAGALGIRLAHEPHPRQSAFDLESCLRLVQALDGHGSFAINLDVGNLLVSHAEPLDFLAHLGGRVVHLHAKDFRPERDPAARDWSFAIAGTGIADWCALHDGLADLGADPVWSLEHEDPRFHRDEGVRLGLDFLRALQREREAVEVWW